MTKTTEIIDTGDSTCLRRRGRGFYSLDERGTRLEATLWALHL
jgi:hypothetical protein